jgi:hypothetical protein
LLTALRHTAYDKTRRDRKVELSDDVSTVSGVSSEAVSEQFDDTAVAGLERSLAAQAFARLPERWQAVLWHTEIEGQSPAEVAPILGLTANGVSALAYRAREGLRQAYLQVHLAETTDRHCRAAAERLGAWTRGGLAKREKAQVEAHLDDCSRCRALAAELADVNGAMRGFVAPLVLGIGAVGYLAATGITKIATVASVGAATGAAGAAGAAAAAPRQLFGVAASSVALAAAIIVGVSAGGENQEIPVAAPVPTQETRPPAQQPPAQQPPVQQPPAEQPQQPPAETPTPPQDPPPTSQPQQPAPPQLAANGPATPIALIAGGAPADLPLTVTNSGGTVSEPVTAVLNLPAGVTAIPVDGFAGRRMLSLNGAKAGTVNCPGGTGTVSCSSSAGLAPGESVTLLFRVVATDNSQGGQITGAVSAGMTVNVAVSVRVTVTPPAVTDALALAAHIDWIGLLGFWGQPVLKVDVTNTGTSSRPVTLRLDQPGVVRWSSQDVTCTAGGGTTCVTTAELAPGETLRVVLDLDPDPWPEKSPHRHQVSVSAMLGVASDNVLVTLWEWLWPPIHDEPPHTSTPPDTTTPPTGSETPTTDPSDPTRPSDPTTTDPPTTKPPATTTPPTTTTTPPDRAEPTPPSTSNPSSGGLGGLLGWLLGG